MGQTNKQQSCSKYTQQLINNSKKKDVEQSFFSNHITNKQIRKERNSMINKGRKGGKGKFKAKQ
jgi:uncharacterized protein YjaZ